MSIAACLIVRDGIQTLTRCLASVRPHVDEVCIYDTGSTDGTLDLLAAMAATPGTPIRVERGAWHNDYARARNEAQAMASSDWLMHLDDDEVLRGGHRLRGLLGRGADLIYLRKTGPQSPGSDMWAWHHDLKVVRRSLGLRWQQPIHEHLSEPPAGAVKGAAHPHLLHFVHLPVQQEGRHDHRADVERWLARGKWVRAMSYYMGGYVLFDDDDPEKAARFLEQAVALPCTERELGYVLQASLLLAECHKRLGNIAAEADAVALHIQAMRSRRRCPFARHLDELNRVSV